MQSVTSKVLSHPIGHFRCVFSRGVMCSWRMEQLDGGGGTCHLDPPGYGLGWMGVGGGSTQLFSILKSFRLYIIYMKQNCAKIEIQINLKRELQALPSP